MISLTHRNKQTDKKDTNELIFKTETDSQTQRANLWLPGAKNEGKEQLGSL